MNKPRQKKEPPKIHVCSKCGSAFNRPYRLRQHEKIHENIKLFVCGELNCNKSYTNKSHLDRHIFSVHKDPEVNVIYSCPQCMKVYVNRQNLKRHIKTHHGRKTGFTCDVCDRYFKKKHLLSAHMYQHTFVKSFSCDFCSCEFITLLEKKKHMKRHKTYSCHMCEMVFVQWSKYLKHKNMMHKEYHCDDCGRKFNKRVHIVHHMKVHHMKVHTTHNTLAFHPCNYENCDKVYTRNGNLKQHIRVKHLKTKHECEICPAKLSSKANLLIHLETHNKPKDSILQPTKEMGRMSRCDKGAAKTSTALRIAGLIIDPENESVRGTLKNIGDSKNEQNGVADSIIEQKAFADPVMEHHTIAYIEQNSPGNFKSEQNGVANLESEQNGVANLQSEQNGVANLESEQNDAANFESEQNDAAHFESEQNGIASMQSEHNGVANFESEQNDVTNFESEQNGVANLQSEQIDIVDSKTKQNGVVGTATEITSKLCNTMDVTVEKIQEPNETNTNFHETLKPDFQDHSMQQICKWNVS